MPHRRGCLLRRLDEHVLPAGRLCVEQPRPVHDGDRDHPGLARRRLLRHRPLSAAGPRRPVATRRGLPPKSRVEPSIELMAVVNQPNAVGAPTPTAPANAGDAAETTATSAGTADQIRPVETTGRIRRILLATDLGS